MEEIPYLLVDIPQRVVITLHSSVYCLSNANVGHLDIVSNASRHSKTCFSLCLYENPKISSVSVTYFRAEIKVNGG